MEKLVNSHSPMSDIGTVLAPVFCLYFTGLLFISQALRNAGLLSLGIIPLLGWFLIGPSHSLRCFNSLTGIEDPLSEFDSWENGAT